jgi:hypothetical protein
VRADSTVSNQRMNIRQANEETDTRFNELGSFGGTT